MLVQELTPMTPEVRHSLMSAEGEKWHGEWGAPHARKQTRAAGRLPKAGAKHGKFSKAQRQFIRYLRKHGKTRGPVLKKKYGFCQLSVSRSLINNGLVFKTKKGSKVFFELTEKGMVCELEKTDQELVRDYMIKLGRFYRSQLEEVFTESVARVGIMNEYNAGRLQKIDPVKPFLWEWVG